MKNLFVIFLCFTILNADIKSLKDSCYDGDFEACGTLALMYAKGDGVSMDKKTAAFFMHKLIIFYPKSLKVNLIFINKTQLIYQ